jgi:hypothetical protein
MKATSKTYLYARMFCLKEVVFAAYYKDMLAYSVLDDSLDNTISGYPSYVLVDKNNKCRYSTADEALEIIDLEN